MLQNRKEELIRRAFDELDEIKSRLGPVQDALIELLHPDSDDVDQKELEAPRGAANTNGKPRLLLDTIRREF